MNRPFFTTGSSRHCVLAHAGEARASREKFQALPREEQDAVIEFLKSLQVLPPGSKAVVVDDHGNPRPWPPKEVL
jgi:hypothetical protein